MSSTGTLIFGIGFSILLAFFVRTIDAVGFRSHFISGWGSRLTKVNQSMSDHLGEICGKQHRLFNLVANSRYRRFPWAVSILSKEGRNIIGGVIISPLHIMTVAHGFLRFAGIDSTPCLTRGYRNIHDLRDRRLAYGGVCIRGTSSTLPNDRRCDQADVVYNKFQIRTVMVDDDFSRGACRTGHDWAIIEVEQPIVFDAGIRPICLPPRNPQIDRQLFIFGWGRENSLFDGSPLLRHTPMNVDARCEAPWSDHLPTKVDDYICLQSINPKNDETPRACHGDSGSGLEQRDRDLRSTLIGITSFGTKGCPRNMLARFTRVDRYLNTICEETGICYTVSDKQVKDGGDSGDDDDDRDEKRQF